MLMAARYIALLGEVKTLLPLDREERAACALTARALDGGGRHCEAAVRIAVEDVNDNAPQFAADPYAVTVFESTEPGTFLARLQASDLDLGANGEVLYSLEDSADGHFSVDERTGVRLSAACAVVVSVLDINDNPPVFEQREYVAAVAEDVAPGSQVLRVFAASRDIEANAEISYAIVSGNERGVFSVNPQTGDIFVVERLDYETSHEFYLTVEATDGGTPSLSDMATVNINLMDVNDNSPVFSQAVYSAVVSEDAELGRTVVTVAADDADGPAHNHVRYSITDGNQGSPFTIDPVKGEVKVARQLDRERISGYTLTVLASDNGSPPTSSSATVNIDVSDVNDNPPVFSQANHSLVLQENGPAGTSVLQLTVTDRDASHNGPPFSFTIVSGNEGGAFQMTQQGALLTATPLQRALKDHYLLQVQVADSGKPQLVSSTFVSIRVIEESVHPPSILPLDIFIATHGDEYPGGVLGKIHATDQDVYDTLTYSLASPADGLFSVSAGDGKVIARKGLDAGHYPLNVTVTDGRFTAAGVSVHVREVTRQALDRSVAVRFASIAPEEFVGDYWRNFLRALRNIAGVRRGDVQLVSLQPAGRRRRATWTCCWRWRRVRRPGDGLPGHLQHGPAELRHARHQRTAVCLCKDGKCPALHRPCEGDPCPEGTECVADPKEPKYTCVCPDGKRCSEGPSLTFGGSGYIKYRLTENENKEEMKLSLRLRTFSSHATVMYAKGTDYSILEIVNGRLQYKFDCGSGPGIVSVHSTQVNDGEWHSVTLEVDGNYAKLVLDRPARQQRAARLRGRHRPGRPGAAAGRPGPAPGPRRAGGGGGRRARLRPAPPRGLLQQPLRQRRDVLLAAQRRLLLQVRRLVHGDAVRNRRQPLHLEPVPLRRDLRPRGDDFYCQCRGQYSGQRCQLGPYCRDNPCKNSGRCIDSLDGPVCECELGFQGDRCLSDVDECVQNPCANGGQCENTYGSFLCNCTLGFGGGRCELRAEVHTELVSTSWNIGLEEVVGIAVFVASIFLLTLVFVLLRKRACCGRGGKPRPRDEDKRPGPGHAFLQRPYFDSKLSGNIYSDVPPQVPVRPISYTPSIPSDSRNNLDRNSFEGSAIPEHPEFSTFNPDAVHGHRKTVAVCSVAPNLPPPPPSNSVSDSDSIQKPSWDYDYDAKVVDLDPCLAKKPLDDVTCHAYNTRGSMSEVQSLSSFQSESCDDNASIVTVIHLVNSVVDSVEKEESFSAHEPKNSRGYHWDTSDWMPSVQLPGIQEYPQYEVVEAPSTLSSPAARLRRPLRHAAAARGAPRPASPGSSGRGRPSPQQQRQYSPAAHLRRYPSDSAEPGDAAAGSGGFRRGASRGYGREFAVDPPAVDSMSLSLYTSTASCSDMSACCEESEVALSDYDSGDEGQRFHRLDLAIPALDAQQHTEV
ncbi:hypothetical protein ANANG_G00097130 [Anguilla anguilla]|uniref:Uncharacterized protein n=1 Tax=Anguilla anguilla TaxID=7936 RepID=A0A9D3RYC5_ANGAN|nr:hypothetical protein ANANG_G00097130 [Anguilla anguilla]